MDVVEQYHLEEAKRQNEELKAENKRLKAEIAQAQAGQRLASIAGAAGANPKAIPDIVGRALASGTWKMDKGGHFSRHGADGLPEFDASGQTVTLESAVSLLRQEAPHLWPEMEEGADQAPRQAPQGGRNPDGRMVPRHTPESGENPWKDGSRNITRQAEIIDSDPERALRLAKAAGKPIRYGMKVGEPLT